MNNLIKELEVSANSDFLAHAPDVARVEVTELDLKVWRRYARFISDHGLYCIKEFDYRCEFLDESHDDDGLNPSLFRQEAPTLVVKSDGVSWQGYEKHGCSEGVWSTDQLSFKEIEEHFNKVEVPQ